MDFSIRLKNLRESKLLTQNEIASLLGIDRSTVGKWESGKTYPNVETLIRLSKFFKVSTDYLVGQVDDPSTILIKGNKLPVELKDLGVEYLEVAKELQDSELSIEDIKQLVSIVLRAK